MLPRSISAFCFVLLCLGLGSSVENNLSDDQKEQPCCSLSIGSRSPRDIILRSSLDGKFSAIDPRTGKVLWVRATGPGPLLSSSISDLELRADGKWFRLVPSLDGTLFRFTGDSVEALPFSADSLLESSFQVAEDTIITGGKEFRTYGIGLLSGRLHYVCTLRGCSKYEGSRDTVEDVLVLKRHTQTVRAVNPMTGVERWNFSVGLHDVSLTSQPIDTKMHAKPTKEDHDYYLPGDPADFPFYQFDVAKGKIFAISPVDDSIIWEQTADSPIVSAWMVRDHQLSVIDLFPRENLGSSEPPQLYLGQHGGSPYIQTSRRFSGGQGSLYPPSSMFHLEWRPLSLLWVPRPSLLNSRNPVFVTHEQDDERALAEVRPWLEYPHNAGFYVLSDDEDVGSVESDSETDTLDYAGIEETDADYDEVGELSENVSNGKQLVSGNRPRPRRPKPKPNVTGNDTSSGQFDDPTFGFWLYLHELSYWWPELLGGILLGGLLTWLAASWARRSEPSSPKVLSENREVAVIAPREPAPTITMNFQNVVVNVRHNIPSGVPSKESKKESGKTRSNSETCAVTARTNSNSSNSSSSSQEFKSKFLHDFEDVERLGAGGFGVVYKATHKIDKCDYAVKRILLPSKKENRDRVMREVQALAKLDHSNIVRYFHTWLEHPPSDWKMDQGIVQRGASFDDYALSGETRLLSRPWDESEDEESDVKGCNDVSSSSSISFRRPTFDDVDDSSSSIVFAEDVNANVEQKANNDVVEKSSSFDVTSSSVVATTNRKVFHQTEVSFSANGHQLTLNDLTVEVRSDRSDCRALVPISDFSDPRTFLRMVASRDCVPRSADSCTTSKCTVNRFRASSESSAATKQKIYLYIQMQLCQKETLKHWLTKMQGMKRPKKPDLLRMFSSIADAVAYIHSAGLIHRDLKPSNIFFAPDGRLKVGDFGLVTAISEDVGNKMFPAIGDVIDGPGNNFATPLPLPKAGYTDDVGTKLYMSPEQVARKPYDSSVDVYSLGLILFELLIPLSTEMERHKLLSALKDKLSFPEIFANEYSEERKLLERMLSHQPASRPTAAEVLDCVQKWLPVGEGMRSATASFSVS